MQLHLENQIAVVIGGASGIGLAIVKEFAREGCRVAIVDRSDQTEAQAKAPARNWVSPSSVSVPM